MLVKSFSGRKLYAARLKAAMTQDDLAYAIRQRSHAKTTGRNVRRWEIGTNAPHSGLIPVIAEAVGVTIDELYETSDDDEDEDPVARLRRIRAELVRHGHDDLADDLKHLLPPLPEPAPEELGAA